MWCEFLQQQILLSPHQCEGSLGKIYWHVGDIYCYSSDFNDEYAQAIFLEPHLILPQTSKTNDVISEDLWHLASQKTNFRVKGLWGGK